MKIKIEFEVSDECVKRWENNWLDTYKYAGHSEEEAKSLLKENPIQKFFTDEIEKSLNNMLSDDLISIKYELQTEETRKKTSNARRA